MDTPLLSGYLVSSVCVFVRDYIWALPSSQERKQGIFSSFWWFHFIGELGLDVQGLDIGMDSSDAPRTAARKNTRT